MIALLLVLASCTKEENKKPSTESTAIVGTWKNTLIQLTIKDSTGKDSTYIEQPRPCESDNLVKFSEDHSITVIYGTIKCDSTEAFSENGGVWTLSDNNTKLTIADAGGTESYGVITLNNSTLKLSAFSGTYVVTFTKQ